MTRIRGANELQARLTAIGNTRELSRQLGLRTVRHAKKTVARKTGHTGRTIKMDRFDDDSVQVSAKGAAVFLEGGTKPHIIRARRARALRFATSGRRLSGSPRRGASVVYARHVRHPGTKPQPFMGPAAKKAAGEAGVVITSAWDSAA